MIPLDILVVISLFAFVLIIRYLYKRNDRDNERGFIRKPYSFMEVALYIVLLPVSGFVAFYWALYYLSARRELDNISLENLFAIFDIAVGHSLIWFVGISVFILFNYLFIFKTGSWEVLLLTIVFIMLILVIFFYSPINDCFKYKVAEQYQSFMFGKSDALYSIDETNNCVVHDVPFDINAHPVKISHAFTHFSSVFRAWGVNSFASSVFSAMLLIVSFIADVLGILGFIESRKRKN